MYMLVSVFDNDIYTEQFNSFEKARSRMIDELKDELFVCNCNSLFEKIENYETYEYNYDSYSFTFDKYCATSDVDGCCCNWKIVEVLFEAKYY